MFCKNCGKELLSNENFCTQCGQKQEAELKNEVVKENNNRIEKTEPVTVISEQISQSKPAKNVEIMAMRKFKMGLLTICDNGIGFKSKFGNENKEIPFSEVVSINAKPSTTMIQVTCADGTIEEIGFTDEVVAVKIAQAIRTAKENGVSNLEFDDDVKKLMVRSDENPAGATSVPGGTNASGNNDSLNAIVSKLKRFFISLLPGKKAGISPKEQKKNRIIAACLIVVFIFLQGSDTVKSYDNESGAVFNMSLSEFCEAFDEAYENIDKPSRYGDSPVNLESLLEENGEEEDSTGAEYENYYAKIENDETGSVAYIEFMVYDGNIGLVSVAFYSIDIEFPIIVTLAVIEACSGVSESKAESIFETVAEDSVTIRMDDISYYVSKVGHFVIRPVSDSYVRAWETKGVTVLEW